VYYFKVKRVLCPKLDSCGGYIDFFLDLQQFLVICTI
jgi:hypothetical protein